MKSEQEPNTKFKIGPIEVTFNSKDKERYKLIVIVLIILFALGFVLIVKVYILPLLLINGTSHLLSNAIIKISGAIKYFKGLK